MNNENDQVLIYMVLSNLYSTSFQQKIENYWEGPGGWYGEVGREEGSGWGACDIFF